MTKRDCMLIACTALIMSIPMAIIAHQTTPQLMPSSAFDWDSIKVVATKNGEKRQIFNAPTTNLDNFECHVSTLNPGETAHLPHQHPEEELTIVKEGSIEVLVNGVTKIVGPGSLVFQASNQLHSTKNAGNTKAVYYAIKWKTLKTGVTKQ